MLGGGLATQLNVYSSFDVMHLCAINLDYIAHSEYDGSSEALRLVNGIIDDFITGFRLRSISFNRMHQLIIVK